MSPLLIKSAKTVDPANTFRSGVRGPFFFALNKLEVTFGFALALGLRHVVGLGLAFIACLTL